MTILNTKDFIQGLVDEGMDRQLAVEEAKKELRKRQCNQLQNSKKDKVRKSGRYYYRGIDK
jgi:hypothetical protein